MREERKGGRGRERKEENDRKEGNKDERVDEQERERRW